MCVQSMKNGMLDNMHAVLSVLMLTYNSQTDV